MEPKLSDIPGILFRTIFRSIARVILLAAWLTLLLTVSLFMASLFLGTWKSSRTRKRQLASDLIVVATQLVSDYRHKR